MLSHHVMLGTITQFCKTETNYQNAKGRKEHYLNIPVQLTHQMMLVGKKRALGTKKTNMQLIQGFEGKQQYFFGSLCSD